MTYETMPENLYLVVEAEPFLSTCREWKHRYGVARAATFAFAEKHGSNGVFPDLYEDLIGLTVQPTVPPGWCIKKARRVAQHDRLVPAKGPAGDVIRAEIEALPKHPRHSEIAQALGHPCQVVYKYEGGKGFSLMGRAFNHVQLGWASDTFMIVVPNAERYVQEHLERYSGCEIIEGRWTVPEGLRSITKSEQELIYAQAAVDQERAVA